MSPHLNFTIPHFRDNNNEVQNWGFNHKTQFSTYNYYFKINPQTLSYRGNTFCHFKPKYQD